MRLSSASFAAALEEAEAIAANVEASIARRQQKQQDAAAAAAAAAQEAGAQPTTDRCAWKVPASMRGNNRMLFLGTLSQLDV